MQQYQIISTAGRTAVLYVSYLNMLQQYFCGVRIYERGSLPGLLYFPIPNLMKRFNFSCLTRMISKLARSREPH